MKLVPADATIEELEKKATDCEEKAKKDAEPEATKLREEASLPRMDRRAALWQVARIAKG